MAVDWELIEYDEMQRRKAQETKGDPPLPHTEQRPSNTTNRPNANLQPDLVDVLVKLAFAAQTIAMGAFAIVVGCGVLYGIVWVLHALWRAT
jgi:hypothetical protein